MIPLPRPLHVRRFRAYAWPSGEVAWWRMGAWYCLDVYWQRGRAFLITRRAIRVGWVTVIVRRHLAP